VKIGSIAALLATLFAVGGCTQWSYDIGEPLTRAQQPAADAQLQDVLQQLGPPQRISSLPGGYVLGWEHWVVKELTLGLSLGPLGADLLAIDWGSAQVSGEFLLLTFNRQHRLVESSFTRWDEHAGGGKALQPSLGLVDVVDVSDLVGAMPQHRWGATSFQRLPRSLNSASSPDSGGSGLEQRGTPNGAGQRTLELED
jgi:hypothetical protein